LLSCGLYAQDPSLYRTIDGQQNNLAHPDWGAAHTPLLRLSGNGFADSISAPAGPDRPNPRYLSNLVFSQPDLLPDPLHLSDFTWVFGQFMDHDLGLTIDNDEPFDISVPTGDPDFDPLGFGTVEINMHRNAFMAGTGTAPNNPLQYINELTSFIDGSVVYGAEQERADWIRTFSGGKLKVSTGNLLPYNTIDGEFDSPIDPNAPEMEDPIGLSDRHFVAGEVRANENPLLITFHTLFVREHNRQCDLLAEDHPDWNDEELYQHARKIVGGLIQSVTYNQWLPTMGVELPEYTGYHDSIHPQLSNVFTAAAFRLGHTLLNSNILRVDGFGNEHPAGHLTLRFGFFNTSAIPEVGGLDPYLAGMAQQAQQSMDSRVIDDVRNFLFGPPGAGGLDLVAININRGRERGLPSFNDIRAAYGLSRYSFIEQITPEIPTYSQIYEAYFGDIERMDPWVAMLAEQRMSGRLFGPTIMRIMETQFAALRDGDRFFYLNDPVLSDEEKDYIHHTTLLDIIMHNTGIALMQDNVFLATPYDAICGSTTFDLRGKASTHTTAEEIADVDIVLSINDQPQATTSTNATGDFVFSTIPACQPVAITANREEEAWINGVSIHDILILSRHILAVEEITSPYQLLAGDADLDGQINVTDIIAIRRLILGLDNQLPGDLSQWVFIPANYNFLDPLHPWDEAYPTSVFLDSPSMMLEEHDFIAYKRGDINASASLGGNFTENDIALAKAGNSLQVVAPATQLKAGESTMVYLNLTAPEKLQYQFALVMDNGQIESISPFSHGAEYAHLTSNGSVRFCGEQDNQLFAQIALTIKSDRDIALSEALRIDTKDLSAYALSTTSNMHAVDLNFKVAEPEVDSRGPILPTILPVPQESRYIITAPTDEQLRNLRLFDANGRLLISQEVNGESYSLSLVNYPAAQ
ncbi:MAG: peroxidase family protein, partial [Bacteroidota bacterium]